MKKSGLDFIAKGSVYATEVNMKQHQQFFEHVTADIRNLRLQIGANVSNLRRQRVMTLEKLARICRMSPDEIDRLELGKGETNLIQIVKLSVGLDVGLEKILGSAARGFSEDQIRHSD